jgi:hypothetical protein
VTKRHTETPAKYDGRAVRVQDQVPALPGSPSSHHEASRAHQHRAERCSHPRVHRRALLPVCGVRSETDYEVHPVTGRFVRKGNPRMDYSGAPGYLFDSNNKYDLEESRDELLTRELMGSLTGDALEALFNTKGVGIASRKTYLRVV